MFGLKQDSIDNHKRFIKKAIENKCVWFILTPEEKFAGCASHEYEDEEGMPLLVIPVWSDKAYASRHLKEEWSNYRIESIDLEIFIHGMLPDFHKNNILVGTNWNAHLLGLEKDPLDLIEELQSTASPEKPS